MHVFVYDVCVAMQGPQLKCGCQKTTFGNQFSQSLSPRDLIQAIRLAEQVLLPTTELSHWPLCYHSLVDVK